MRVTVFAALFVIETFCHRNIMSSSEVRPHGMIRFLIQSVTTTKPNKFSEFEITEIAKGQFCQVASSLVDYTDEKNVLPFFEKFSKRVQEGTESTRVYLQDLGNKFRLDDLRRAGEMHFTWSETIDKELAQIQEVVVADEVYHGKMRDTAGRFHSQADAAEKVEDPSGSSPPAPKVKKYHDYLFKDVFKTVSAERLALLNKDSLLQTGSLTDQDKELIGIRSHSVKDWEEIAKHHSDAVEKLKKISDALLELRKIEVALFQSSYEAIRSGDELQIKWSSESAMNEIPKFVSSKSQGTNRESEPNAGNVIENTEDNVQSLGRGLMNMIATPLPADFSPAAGSPSSDNSPPFVNFLRDETLHSSPVATMDKLSTTLSVLYIRKKALEDAENSLGTLDQLIDSVQTSNSKAINELVVSLQTILDGKRPLAQSVYRDIARYPEEYKVEIEYDGKADLYKVYKDAVNSAAGKADAIAEIHLRINLLANVGHRVHGHMLAFINEWTSAAPRKTDNKDLLDLEGKKISKTIQRARVAAQCLLYGRYDVLFQEKKRPFPELTDSGAGSADQNKLNEAEDKWCVTTHEKGLDELRSNVIDDYVILGLEDGAKWNEIDSAYKSKEARYNVHDNGISGKTKRIWEQIQKSYQTLETKTQRDGRVYIS